MKPRRAVAALLCLSFSACAVGPNYQRPAVPAPPQFYGALPPQDARSLADLPWWSLFDDPVLNGLVDEALRHGFDARLAAARVEEARALYGVARGAYYPQVGATAGVVHERADQFSNPEGTARTKWTAEVGFQWELDLWGRVRRLNESARAEYLASEEARRGVLLTLLADVASAYFALRELDEELEIARRTQSAFQDTYDLFDRQLRGGTASALETTRAEALLGLVSAQIPEIEREIVQRENQINLLLGRPPQPIERGPETTPLPPDVPAGLPSALLERRPDIRQAEQLLVSANAQVGVAKAAFFPTLSLTGLFGNVSPELGQLFSQGKTWSIGGNLFGGLFTGGSRRRQYEAAQARWEQARVRYEQAVVQSLAETSSALVSRSKLAEVQVQRERAVRAYREAVRLADLRYRSGLSAYFEVLEAQQQLYPTELNLAATRRDRLIAVVDLYRSLGGGWAPVPPGAAPTFPRPVSMP